ncbi:MAG: DNA polymerase III subunit [Candidatus Moraniibacteriota bacterium]|nr:MAG: DNA polymerase III subunit [Candidatus Moranbacteria bacterium]
MISIGHTTIVRELETLLRASEVPQSFLFDGPRHVGKRTVALWFAQGLMGEGPKGMPQADLFILEPEQARGTKKKREQLIQVESIREAQKFLALSPVGGRRRVLIIDGAEKLGMGAANALLKLLEEPPEKSCILLLTAEPGLLLPTIQSRVVSFHFRPVPGEVIRQSIPEAELLPQFFTDLGLPGLVRTALTDEQHFLYQKEVLRQLFQLSKLSWRERLMLAEELAQDERAAREFLEIWCTGLVFQVRQKTGSLARHYIFLEQLLKTLKSLSRGEGAARPLLEKLFFSL